MPAPAHAAVRIAAQSASLRRLANVRLLANGSAFDAVLLQDIERLGLNGDLAEGRLAFRAPMADLPALARGDTVEYSPDDYSLAELAALPQTVFSIDAIEPHGAAALKVWLV